MAITEAYTGTRDNDATEWSLTANNSYDTGDAKTTDGVFQLWLDVFDMAAGEVLRIRGYEKARTGDTQRIFFEAILRDVQSLPLVVTPAFVLMQGWDFTTSAIAGTITVLWSVRQIS